MTNELIKDGVIDGRAAARVVRAEVKRDIIGLLEQGVHPQVAFIRVGDDPASEVYVNAKAKACGWVNLRSKHIHLPSDVSRGELEALVYRLNKDDDIDGILIQLPLPDHLNDKEILNRVRADKDVDGFHPVNLGGILAGRGPLEPCTPAGIIRLMELAGIEPRGKLAVVIGRSVIVGRPMVSMLLRAHATVIACHRHTRNLRSLVEQAEILVVATGVPRLIKGDWLRRDAYVFDVGTTRLDDGSLCGDVEFDVARGRVAGITPVPGGIGPMTIAQLLKNTVHAAKIRRGIEQKHIIRA